MLTALRPKPESIAKRTRQIRGNWTNLEHRPRAALGRQGQVAFFRSVVAPHQELQVSAVGIVTSEDVVRIPSLDLSESADAVQVHMDVPGVKPSDLGIQINGNVLTITGKREEEKEEKERTFHRIERSSGSFSRTVTLPCAIDEAKVDAKYKDGILTVALPKTPEAKSHKIMVKS